MSNNILKRSLLLAIVCVHTTLIPVAVYAKDPSASAVQSEVDQQELPDEEIIASVKSAIANYFSMQVGDITLETDLIKDLKADYMDAYEIVAMICEEHGVIVPKSSVLRTVREISVYLETAELKDVEFSLRGRGKPSGGGNKNPVVTQKVFFATNRKTTGKTNPNKYFDGQRASLKEGIKYGICEVTIPAKVHAPGKIERPTLLFPKENPKQHIVLKTLEVLEWENFINSINLHTSQSDGDDNWSNDAFVFIHGYNVTFDKAARRTAQIAYDYGFKGAPILFSWPSDGKNAEYFSDRIDAEWSALYIEQFLTSLRKKSTAKRLHLIAHSMGNQGLLRALYRVALKQGEDTKPLFDNVIMAAPDFDTRLFTEQIAPRIRSLSKSWTIYTSDKDSALDLSAYFSSAKRLGKPVSVVNGFDTIDVTDIDVSPWSVPEFHSYYASKKRVITDLISVLKNKKPVSRKLIPKMFEGIQYWQLK
jgi:acyl carrier protein